MRRFFADFGRIESSCSSWLLSQLTELGKHLHSTAAQTGHVFRLSRDSVGFFCQPPLRGELVGEGFGDAEGVGLDLSEFDSDGASLDD